MFSLTKKIAGATMAVVMLAGSLPLTVSAATATDVQMPEGFVYANGTRFECDGDPYYYAGTNCYYLTFKSQESVDNVFEDAQAMGLKVIRVWGNLDVGVKTDEINKQNGAPIFTDNNDGPGEKDGIYFQYFDSDLNRPVVNEGEDGLMKLDYAIYQAEQHGMKLLITFTNYWDAFGGMGQYIDWAEQIGITGLKKEDFYTNETLKTWYKEYIYTLLNHENSYTGRKLKDEPGVFAWELSNEPRCSSDQYCKDDILYNWAKEMSEYVKSVDPYHMVSVGDEGFYNKEYGYYNDYTTSNYAFYGAEGVDFEKLMTIDTIDFGTPHLYLDQWGMKHTGEGQDDLLWFRIHGETCAELDKPVILEEFGLTNKTIRDSEYEQWFDVLEGNVYENVEYAGTNYWMIASYVDGTLYPDYDQYTVYGCEGTSTETTRRLIMEHAQAMNAKNIENSVNPSSVSFDRSQPDDVVTTVTVKQGNITGVTLDGESLPVSAYTLNGNIVTIKGDYLASLELSTYNFKVICSEGNDPSITVAVSDSSIPEPVVTPTAVSVDQYSGYVDDVVLAVDKKTSEFRGITLNGKALTLNTDYTVSGTRVTILKSFLKTLAEGVNVLVFDFYEGADKSVTLTVTDSTSTIVFDDFEGYTDSNDVWQSYQRNTGGNELSLDIEEKNESNALAFGYDVSGTGYCGVNHPIASRDVSSFDGIQFDIEGDGSGNSFTLQIKDGNDKYFEYQLTVDFTASKTVQIPFDIFTSPSWQSEASLDTKTIEQFSLYAGNGGTKSSGTYYIDNIVLYSASNEKTGAYLSETSGTYNAQTDVSVLTKLVLDGETVTSLTVDGKTLTANTDYSWNGSQVMLNKAFLDTLADGVYEITYNFSKSGSDIFTLTVINSKVVKQLEKSVVTATAGNKCAELSWTAVDNAAYYHVIRYKAGEYQLIATVKSTSVTVMSLTNNYKYAFLIKAVAENGVSSLSDAVWVTPVGVLEKTVLTATPGDKCAQLSWTAVEGAEYYQIIRYKSGKYELIANISGTSATVMNLVNNYNYAFLINAVADDGSSSLSAAVWVKPARQMEKAVVTATACDKSAQLSWTAVEGAEYYQIIRYKSGKYELIANISGTSATVMNLANNYNYAFLINAVSEDGSSSLSDAVWVTPKA